MRVAALVPVHGFAPFLPETLDGLLAQTTAVDRIVVVDDGSEVPVVLHPDHAEAGIVVLRRDVAGGPAQARADGLAEVTEHVDVVALCDADDTWEPGHLAAHLAAWAAAPGIGWSFGRAIVVDDAGIPTGETWAEPAAGRHAADVLARDLFVANPVPTSSVVLDVDAVADAGGFAGPVRVAEDWELWLRLCRAGHDALCVPDAVVRYRRHDGGLTADVARLARAQLAVHAAHADLVEEDVADAVRAGDLAALAAGLARDGDHEGARIAWGQVAGLRPLTPGERARRLALAVPGLRGRVGRAAAY